jgi:hypothetical protein
VAPYLQVYNVVTNRTRFVGSPKSRDTQRVKHAHRHASSERLKFNQRDFRMFLLLPARRSWCQRAPRSSSSRGRTCTGRKSKRMLITE